MIPLDAMAAAHILSGLRLHPISKPTLFSSPGSYDDSFVLTDYATQKIHSGGWNWKHASHIQTQSSTQYLQINVNNKSIKGGKNFTNQSW